MGVDVDAFPEVHAPEVAQGPAAIPVLTLQQHATMMAELIVRAPAKVYGAYGLTDDSVRAAVLAVWEERLNADAAERAAWQNVYAEALARMLNTKR